MKLTDEDYWSLAEQCARDDFGRIDRDDEMVYVTMETFIEYDELERRLTGGIIPKSALCTVIDVDFDTKDGSEVEVDTRRIEKMTLDILMQY